ncbi:MAG TPA: hypothetical protein DCP92_03080 [Nitrospiraceae bacterium]|nr:hypothetical protein [Nitrospiraceae bacterium]
MLLHDSLILTLGRRHLQVTTLLVRPTSMKVKGGGLYSKMIMPVPRNAPGIPSAYASLIGLFLERQGGNRKVKEHMNLNTPYGILRKNAIHRDHEPVKSPY